MDLKIKDVAELLNVSSTTIRRWLSEGKIPAYRLNQQYRFNRNEIENWVMGQKLSGEIAPFSTKEKKKETSGGTRQFSLYRALHRGDVLQNVIGSSKEEVIRNTMDQFAGKLDLDKDVLTDLLLDRERLMSTGLGSGIAVPHTRDFLLSEHFDALVIAYPEKPIPFGSLDGNPVHTLFFLFACSDKRHLHLLAKIAHLSQSDEFLDLLQQRPNKADMLLTIKNWESQVTPIDEQDD